MKTNTTRLATGAILVAIALPASADQVILDDLIVDGSACIGFDCVNGESFGFDTIRIKENNLRIKAQDTSSSASFPSNDWQITFNDSANGGANKFSIDDIDGGRTPFTIEAGAPSHSLYVDDGGRIGIRTSTPVVDLHVKSGNTPTLRLEQDGSTGFTPQTWDVAGNEANFFIRDATSGSTLPFRIFPGAPSNALTIEGSTGDVGIGTTSPAGDIHIFDSGTGVAEHADLILEAGSQTWRQRVNNATGELLWSDMVTGNNVFRINDGAAQNLMRLGRNLSADAADAVSITGNLFVSGDVVVSGNCTETDGACAPDYVFEPDYELMPLAQLKQYLEKNRHLPNVPDGSEMENNGFTVRGMSYALLRKVEELTLYTLEQQETIDSLRIEVAELREVR